MDTKFQRKPKTQIMLLHIKLYGLIGKVLRKGTIYIFNNRKEIIDQRETKCDRK